MNKNLNVFAAVVILIINVNSNCQGASGQDEENLKNLINKLAIANSEATEVPVYTPSVDEKPTDKRMVAFDAAEKLLKKGAKIIPLLLENIDDKRQSVSFSRQVPSTVGGACFNILKRLIERLPSDYDRSIYRKDRNGELAGRPGMVNNFLFDRSSIKSWLDKRKKKRFEEIQLEVLEWYIKEEKKIGFSNEKEREEYLKPLEKEVFVITNASNRSENSKKDNLKENKKPTPESQKALDLTQETTHDSSEVSGATDPSVKVDDEKPDKQ